MDIIWYGQACFKLKGKTTSVVTDPFSPTFTSLKLPKITADIVTVSHSHEDHNYVAGVGLEHQSDKETTPVIIAGPGEYEVRGVTIAGVSTFHDKNNGAERGKNSVYQIIIDGIAVVHLGDLGHTLSKEQVATIGQCDILLVPVGGVYTIDASDAQEVISELEPSIVVPMHYKIPTLKFDLDPIEKFLKEIGKEAITPLSKLSITKDKLPQEVETVLLEKQ